MKLLGEFRHRDRVVLGLLLLLSSACYFSLRDAQGHRGGVAELDGYYYYVYLRSLHADRDIDLRNDYLRWGNPFGYGETKTGMMRNVFGIGPAIAWSPFFVATDGIARIANSFGAEFSTDAMSRLHQVGTFYGSLVYGWLAVCFSLAAVRRLVGCQASLVAALGAALAGPLPYYCLTRASYSHAQAALATSLLVYLWARFRGQLNLRRWIALGAAAGLMMLIRPACAAFLLLLLVEIVRLAVAAARRRTAEPAARVLVGPVAALLTGLLLFSPQLVAWHALYGTPLLVPQGEGFLWWSANAWPATLFSPRNGLFTSAPLMVVAVLGLVFGARRQPRLWLLLGVFVLHCYLCGAVHDWWGWEFSARRFTSCLPLFSVGLALAARWVSGCLARRPAQTAGWACAAAIVVSCAFNLQWLSDFVAKNRRWYQLRSSQKLYMTVSHGLVDRVYAAVGNPLSLPASLAFAVRRGGSLRDYDRLSGSYLLGESNPRTNPAADPYAQASMNLGSHRFGPNLSDAFGSPVRSASVSYVPLRRPRAHVFLPINRPGKLRLLIHARAVSTRARVRIAFNNHRLGERTLTPQWGTIDVEVPARWVERGINRLDLDHRFNRPAQIERRIGISGQQSPADLAVASAGAAGGRFCEIWFDGQLVAGNHHGVNVAVIDPVRGALRATAAFDAHLYPEEFDRLARYLSRLPKGAIVALGTRGNTSRHFDQRARRALAQIGATTDLRGRGHVGYAAIGAVGLGPGEASESVAIGRALAHVGRKPPPWRELARYAAIELR